MFWVQIQILETQYFFLCDFLQSATISGFQSLYVNIIVLSGEKVVRHQLALAIQVSGVWIFLE